MTALAALVSALIPLDFDRAAVHVVRFQSHIMQPEQKFLLVVPS